MEEGDTLTLADGRSATVTGVTFESKPAIVYNMEVADFHTYYVGEDSVLVHNTTGCILEGGSAADNAATECEGESEVVDVKLSRKKYPESAQHIEEAIKEGQPDTLTIDRRGASSRRKASLQGVNTVPGLDRDEYPPAMSKEGGTGASVKLINPSDNRGSGSSISGKLRNYPNGTKYRIIITDEE